MARSDWASWLSGPRAALPGRDPGAPGARLGLPAAGRGSVAGVGRRLAALCLDWAACLVVAHALTPDPAQRPLLTLEVFFAQVAVLTALTGSSFGQRLVGVQVVAVTGERLGVLRTLVRTALICAVVPALVWDRDWRGVHDMVAGSVAVRR